MWLSRSRILIGIVTGGGAGEDAGQRQLEFPIYFLLQYSTFGST